VVPEEQTLMGIFALVFCTISRHVHLCITYLI